MCTVSVRTNEETGKQEVVCDGKGCGRKMPNGMHTVGPVPDLCPECKDKRVDRKDVDYVSSD